MSKLDKGCVRCHRGSLPRRTWFFRALLLCVLAGWSYSFRAQAVTIPHRVAGGLLPVHLETESLVGPVGVDSEHPRFSWELSAVTPGARNLRQSAYRVLVASSAGALARGDADVWDSGRVEARSQLEIAFAGAPLAPRTRYHWKVMAWDQDGRASRWSAAAVWYSGMLRATEWKARWIAAAPDKAVGPTREGVDLAESKLASVPALPLFRREFSLDRAVASAVVAVSGLGQYELLVNGRNVTASVMNPGWTDYRKRVFYNMYDVTQLLRPGGNALGVTVGNGMYHVPNVEGRYTKFSGSFGQPKLILQMTVKFTDGSVMTVVTDSSWRTSPGPITFSSIYGGEDYDARRDHSGWEQRGYKADGWERAVEVAGPGGALVAQLLPRVAVRQIFRPVHVVRMGGGVTVYDLGKNFSGWPAIVVRGRTGSRVKLVAGELLDASGHVTQASNNAHPGWENSFSYTLKGGGAENWHPQFSYNGFRYVQVELSGIAPEAVGAPALNGVRRSQTGERPVILSLTGSFLDDDVAVVGQFLDSKELHVQIHGLIDQAILSNMFSVLTDCPTREKLGWLEQTHLAATSIMYNYDVRQLYDKLADDMGDSQTSSGLVPAIAPEFVEFVNAKGESTDFRDTPEWGSASILSPLAAYRFYGEKAMLAQHFDTMERYAEYLGSRTHDHMLDYGLGDWYDIGPAAPGVSQLTGKGLTATAIFYQDLVGMAEIARVLGKEDSARRYLEEAGRVKAAFNQKFFHAESGTYDSGSQTANAMPFVLGLVPEERRRDVLAHLVADIRSHGDHVTAGDIGFHYVVRALTDGGRSDVLADMLSRTDSPSYGYQLKRGATSLTEAWDSNPVDSQNHFMLGHAEEWFYRGLAGIDIDFLRTGADRLRIRPTPVAGLDSAAASVETVFGEVHSEWKRERNGMVYDVTIPPGQDATVVLVASDLGRVAESGRRLGSMNQPVKASAAGGLVTIVLGSGSYHFAVRN